MNLSLPRILDVALGLILIYLTLSIFASEIQEIITAWLQLRAKHLKKSIYRLFGGTHNSKKLERQLRGIEEENQVDIAEPKKTFSEEEKIINLVKKIYQQSVILSIIQSTLGISAKNDISSTLYGPSYITAEDFSEALIDVLSKDFGWSKDTNLDKIKADLTKIIEKQPISTLTELNEYQKKSIEISYCDRSLKRLYEAAKVADTWYRKKVPNKLNEQEKDTSDLGLFKIALMDWYDKSQYHSSGTYKRNSKYLLFIIGLFAAISLNANTFQIAQNLLTHPEKNLDISTISDEIIRGCDTGSGFDTKAESCKNEIQEVNKIINEVQATNLPLGWTLDNLNTANLQQYFNKFSQDPFNALLHLIYQLVGWTISALAIMMGATFWFDTLKKFVNIRNTVAPPSASGKTSAEATTPKK